MNRILVILAYICLTFISYSQKNYSRWNVYVQPILDSISANNGKKVVLNSYFLIDKENGKKFDSILLKKYYLDSVQWRNTWRVWKNNYLRNSEWKDWISHKKKDRILRSNRYKRGELEMLSVSEIIFISPDVYLLGIARHCLGFCGNVDIYIVRIDRSNNRLIVEEIVKNVIVS